VLQQKTEAQANAKPEAPIAPQPQVEAPFRRPLGEQRRSP